MNERKIRDTVPESGHNILTDMLSETTSLQTKAWAARRLTEQMVSVFLYEDADPGQTNKKPSLGEMIDKIKLTCGSEILSAIREIKEIGDKASHYSKEYEISQKSVERVASLTLDLFSMILTQKCKSHNILKLDNYSLYIFSTLYPSVREKVLSALIDFNGPFDSREKYTFLEKYGKAAAKAGRLKQASRRFDKLAKQGQISHSFYVEMKESMRMLDDQRAYLPTANDIATCRRNFEEAMKTLSDSVKSENAQLIDIINRLLY